MEHISFICKKTGKLSKIIATERDDISYSQIMKSFRNKDVLVNGKRTNKDEIVRIGDRIEIFFVETVKQKYDVIYSDSNVIVINKKSGFTSEEVYEKLKSDCADCCFIHRLDRNTSGIMIFALNGEAESELLKGFKNRTFDKYYTATVIGKMPKQRDVLGGYLVKDSKKCSVRVYSHYVKGATQIKTGYSVISEDEDTSKIKVKLFTGKTHQIRAHLSFIGNPVVGDEKYGDSKFNKSKNVKRQMLVASCLVLHFDKESKLSYLDNREFSI